MQSRAHFTLASLIDIQKAGWGLLKQTLLHRKWNWIRQNFHFIFRKQNWLIMRLTTILLLSACLQVSANGFSQVVTLSEKNISLQKVFKQIHKQTGYQFFYEDEMLNKAGRINIKVKDKSLEKVLAICFKDLPLSYSIVDNVITVKQKTGNPVQTIEAPAFINIQGTVKDEKGNPLSGVSVILKGTNKGTSTDVNGHFTMDANAGDVLEFTIVGFEKRSVTIGQSNNLAVVMEIKAVVGNEVVVVGYGTQKKSDLTGAIGVVTASQFENQPITNSSQILAGKVAGVDINQNSGLAGDDDARIVIRGVGTLNSTSPLIIIDGVVASSSATPLANAFGSGTPPKDFNPLSSIDPEDIESITVLKDAAAAAIYGSRAANGVILITTKQGKKGKAVIKYNGYYGTTVPTSLPKMVNNTIQFMNLMNEANVNSGQAPSFPDSVINKFESFGDTTNTNWMKVLFNPEARISSHNLTISGGSEETKYFMSLGLLNQNAMVGNGNFKRYNGRVNLDSKVLSNLTIGTRLTFSRGEQNMPSDDILNVSVLDAMRATPVQPVFTNDGKLALLDGTSFFSVNQVQAGNALYRSYGNQVLSVTQSFLGFAYADWEIINGLHLRGTFTVDINPYDRSDWTSNITGYNWRYKQLLAEGYPLSHLTGLISTASLGLTHSESKMVNPYIQINYHKTVGKNNFDLLIGASQEKDVWNYFATSRRTFSSNATRILSAGDPSTQMNNGSATHNSLVSQFARVDYNFDSKYLFQANVRRDGSSRFADNNKYGIFPSFSAGWVISSEKFMAHLKPINFLKIRASWGQLGNQSTSDFPYVALITFGQNYNFSGTTVGGATQSTYGSPDLKWETTATTDVGIDAYLFNSKLNIVVDYYKKITKGILYNTPLPSITGFTSVISNLASVENGGIEFTANYNDNIGKLKYSLGLNISYNKNQLLYINSQLSGKNDRVVNGNYALLRGQPVDAIYGLKAIGIFQDSSEINKSPKQFSATGPGDLKYEDISGPDGKPDGVIDGNDRQVLGKESPSWLYGFNLGAEYKNFKLSVLFQGIGDAQTYGFYEYFVPTFQGSNIAQFWENGWTPTHHSTSLPRLWNTSGPNTQLPNSFFVQNRAYLRLKNVTITYDLRSILKKTFLTGVKLYVSGQNLFTITKFKGFDPEQSYELGRSGIPQIKMYTAGLNISL